MSAPGETSAIAAATVAVAFRMCVQSFVLSTANAFIAGDYQIETGLLGHPEEISIRHFRPSPLVGDLYGVSD